MTDIPASSGIYALFLNAGRECSITVGRFGKAEIHPGDYVYIGSAFGPGGMRSRIGRHSRVNKKCRWHIDYLRRYMSMLGVIWCASAREQEHLWAGKALSFGEVVLKGLGSSDCSCISHFLRLNNMDALVYDLKAGGGCYISVC
ncbi:GIY-YIG nuclease family protein [Limisalsivibrio acetivorans]|uniref:GIY-YIG nuclease family protein n=1 Tax=Limisalsivibrio acetivorans TaxID=1304888 RepID=UPI0003B3AC13|nr:GIY-YIG nuclease family protein [Limisalsivibrio acetivorans]